MGVSYLHDSGNSGAETSARRDMSLYLDSPRQDVALHGLYAQTAEPDAEAAAGGNAESLESLVSGISPGISYIVREANTLFADLGEAGQTFSPSTDEERPHSVYHNTNLLILLDLSFLCRHEASQRNGLLQARVQTAQIALSNLLHAYSMFGLARAAVCAFSQGATVHFPWGDSKAAIASLKSLQVHDLFNATNPIAAARHIRLADGRLPEDAHNVAYFLSEGRSEVEEGMEDHMADTEKALWHNFLHGSDMFDRTFAVAFNHQKASPTVAATT